MEQEKDFTEYFANANAKINSTDYWRKRGLTEATVERFKLGYDPAWRSASAPASVQPTPRLIIPITQTMYLARHTASDDDYAKMLEQIGGKDQPVVFNRSAIDAAWQDGKPLFVVEGEIDAMSLEQVGAHAVALRSTANVEQLCAVFKEMRIDMSFPTCIIMLDADAAGKDATEVLEGKLKNLDLEYQTVGKSALQGCKDPNELLCKSEAALKELVANEVERAEKSQVEYRSKMSSRDMLKGLIDGRYSTEPVPTGFKDLDKVLDGGLFPELTVIGATSSSGKSAFVGQVADNIACGVMTKVYQKDESVKEKLVRRDVLIFSIEMSPPEYMARSLSRETFKAALQEGYPINDEDALNTAFSSREIMNDGLRYRKFKNETSAHLYVEGEARYEHDCVDREFFPPCPAGITAKKIIGSIEDHIKKTKARPVVVIDYLQNIAPEEEEKRSDRRTQIDSMVTRLRVCAAENKVPIVAISSFSRGANTTGATMDAFKESGGIEYGADLLIGLASASSGQGKDKTEAQKLQSKERKAPFRSMRLTILKQRNGRTGEEIEMTYAARCNHFREISAYEDTLQRRNSSHSQKGGLSLGG